MGVGDLPSDAGGGDLSSDPGADAVPHGAGGGDVSPDVGAPVGRRIFLGLLGAGLAGLLWERHLAAAGDETTPSTVAQVVPLSPDPFATPPPMLEPDQGVHPNLSNLSERFRYYSVGDIPDVDLSRWRLRVHGAGVRTGLSFSIADLQRLPNYLERATFRCVTGWRVPDCVWRGVRLRDVLAAAGSNAQARFVTFSSMDGVYTESLTWEQASSAHVLLAWELNGAPLIREQGYPLRVIFPDMYGYKGVKWLDDIEVTPRRQFGFWEVHGGWEVDAYVYTPDLVGQSSG